MGTDNTQFRQRFRVWRRKVRERNSDFSLRSMELGWSSCDDQDIKSEYSARATRGYRKPQVSPGFHAGGSGSRKLQV